MKMRTAGEWANFTGCFTVKDVYGNLKFYTEPPQLILIESSECPKNYFSAKLEWDDKNWAGLSLNKGLFIPFEGDWRDCIFMPSLEIEEV